MAAALSLVVIGAAEIGPARSADPAAMGWTIVEASGDARYRLAEDDGAAWRQVQAGHRLNGPVELETGQGGRILLAQGGDTIAVSPDSRILLPKSAKPGHATRVFQSLGVSLYKVMKRAPQVLVGGPGRFEVHTPYLVSTVKGTTFAVSVSGQGASVDLIEGVLQVATADNSFSTQISAGHLARVTAGAPRTIEVMGADGTGRRSVGREVRADVPPAAESDGQAPTVAQTPARGPRATPGGVAVVIERSGGPKAQALAGRPAKVSESVKGELARLNRDLADLGNGRGTFASVAPPHDGSRNGGPSRGAGTSPPTGAANGLANGAANGLANGAANGLGNGVAKGIHHAANGNNNNGQGNGPPGNPAGGGQ